jgi:histidinol-phosphate aminotransferase
MFDLKELVRPNIWKLQPYSSARSEFSGDASVWIDANENPYNNPYDRYPDPLQKELKAQISQVKGIHPDQIFLGVGSDECIDLVYRVFCRPSLDNVVAISPSYGMYGVCARVNEVEYTELPLEDDFSINYDKLRNVINPATKVLWICSPNNPTGNAFTVSELTRLCVSFDGIVVIDEAYTDFSSKGSMLKHLWELPNLIVLQTFSKAWGSAGVRLGMAFASPEIISIFNKVKYPYNINMLTQRYAMDIIKRQDEVKKWVKVILEERAWLIDQLNQLPIIKHIYPTDANFMLVKVENADALYAYLRDKGIIVRNRNTMPKCANCLRFTVGTHAEDEELIKALKNYGK